MNTQIALQDTTCPSTNDCTWLGSLKKSSFEYQENGKGKKLCMHFA